MTENNKSLGWIKLHRKILNNPIATNIELLGAWSWILLRATHRTQEFYFGKSKVHLDPGELIWGEKSAAEKWGVSASKARRIINLFKNEELIEVQATNKFSLVKVKNWSRYQESEEQNEEQMKNKRRTNEEQMKTYKNVKNVKNVKKSAVALKAAPIHLELANLMARGIAYTNPAFKTKWGFSADEPQKVPAALDETIKKWAEEIEKLCRLDHADPEQVRSVITWLYKGGTKDSDFWQTNIRSGDKLRKQWQTLVGRAIHEIKLQINQKQQNSKLTIGD